MDDFGDVLLPVFEFRSFAWMDRSLCSTLDEDTADALFFPERGGSGKAARKLCARCPVQSECLGYAISNAEKFGIWGGTSERDRRPMRKQRRQLAS